MRTCDQSGEDNRGDAAGETGDNLLPIDFGSGFVPYDWAYGTVSYQVCALAANNDIKCWGANWYGCPSDTTLWGDSMMSFETGFDNISDFCVGWGTQCALSRFVVTYCAGSWRMYVLIGWS